MPEFRNFPSIEGFYNIVKFFAKNKETLLDYGKYTYRAKIKLHGTNAGITIENGEVAAQSKTQFITPKADNMGFAKWVESTVDYWKALHWRKGGPITVFGEWCGSGIMKGTAISKIGKKIFAVFAIAHQTSKDDAMLIVDPSYIEYCLGETRPSEVYVLPWFNNKQNFDIDFNNRENLQINADLLNSIIKEIEPCDPWVKSVFDITGVAEGLVLYPVSAGMADMPLKTFEDFGFKIKGQEHQHVHTKELVQIDPEVAANAADFAAMFVTEIRCEQGIAACGGTFESKNIGNFIKWMNADILKESVDELAASKLAWSQVQKPVQTAARTWFLNKNRTI